MSGYGKYVNVTYPRYRKLRPAGEHTPWAVWLPGDDRAFILPFLIICLGFINTPVCPVADCVGLPVKPSDSCLQGLPTLSELQLLRLGDLFALLLDVSSDGKSVGALA